MEARLEAARQSGNGPGRELQRRHGSTGKNEQGWRREVNAKKRGRISSKQEGDILLQSDGVPCLIEFEALKGVPQENSADRHFRTECSALRR